MPQVQQQRHDKAVRFCFCWPRHCACIHACRGMRAAPGRVASLWQLLQQQWHGKAARIALLLATLVLCMHTVTCVGRMPQCPWQCILHGSCASIGKAACDCFRWPHWRCACLQLCARGSGRKVQSAFTVEHWHGKAACLLLLLATILAWVRAEEGGRCHHNCLLHGSSNGMAKQRASCFCSSHWCCACILFAIVLRTREGARVLFLAMHIPCRSNGMIWQSTTYILGVRGRGLVLRLAVRTA